MPNPSQPLLHWCTFLRRDRAGRIPPMSLDESRSNLSGARPLARVVSVNVGQRRRLEGRSFRGETGIFKSAVQDPIAVHRLGLEADSVVNTRHHGGVDQAVYLYRDEDYDWWSGELGRSIGPGTFGENLTLAGLAEPGLVIGTRLVFPGIELEVSAPRIPCNTLAQRMDDVSFVKRFLAAERPGFYCRVIRTGRVSCGDPVTVEERSATRLTTLELFRGLQRRLDRSEIEAFLEAPIDERTRRKFQSKLSGRGG